ncbi:hypothetical protein WJX73_003878 [Symbiochloris irregularis]|uniref:U3 small nucleolar RNA-associated protein 18 n=1 Tax=Symbiochloris irregularis TaxID=706552 RepID=A0AAW1NP92_9CHLO
MARSDIDQRKRRRLSAPQEEQAKQLEEFLFGLRKLRENEEEMKVSGKEYERRLRQLHKRMNPRTSWANSGKNKKLEVQLAGQDSDTEAVRLHDGASAEALLQGAGRLLNTRTAVLPSGSLEVSRVKDANVAEPSNAVIRSVEFHPSGQLLLTAGLDKRVRFFQVDGVRNDKIQSIYLEDLPIHKAAFARGGSQVVATGRRKHFYILDLEAAKVERVQSLVGCSAKSFESFVVSPTC